jgi:hypothetical protein
MPVWLLAVMFLLGVPVGVYYCRAKMKARRKVEEVTLAPEREQFQSLMLGLRGLNSDLQGTARLLAERTAQHVDNVPQSEQATRMDRRDDDGRI